MTITMMLTSSVSITPVSAEEIDSGQPDEQLTSGVIGSLGATTYTSFKDLVDDLEDDYKGKFVLINMMKDWNAAVDSDFNRRLIIPKGCSAVLFMNGHVFNRNLAWDNDTESNGELICMQSNSTLRIIGSDSPGEESIAHPQVSVYTSTEKSGKANGRITTYGGTLTGGSSTNGAGGIHVKDKCTLRLDDVTIAGCSSRAGTRSNGYGGGIYINDDYSTITLNNSTVTGCFADIDGGGIYANDEPTTIELNGASIVKNYAARNGGGFYTNDENITISGRNNSEISYNGAGNYGGGVCMWYSDSSLSGVTMRGNSASKKGGAVYLDSTGIGLSDLVITGSSAERGGGVFLYKSKCSITNCEITGNKAGVSGGGVYVDSNVSTNFSVGGKTIIRDNSAAMDYARNFYFSDDTPTDNRANFSLAKGSDVHVGYWATQDRDSIMVTEGKPGDTKKTPNCIQYLTADNTDYHFTYNSAPEYRKIFYVKNGKDSSSTGDPAPAKTEPVTVSAANAINNPGDEGGYWSDKAGVVGTYGGNYDLIRGFSRHEETDSDTNDSSVMFFYSDGFFADSPEQYSPQLATASLTMAYAGMYLRAIEPADDRDPTGNYYYNRHAAARQFMADIGCLDQDIYVNESNEKKPGTDSIGVTIASKELTYHNGEKTGYILVPVVVRGGGYELEWASNATLDKASDMTEEGKEAEAKGFSSAADQVMDEIARYITAYGLEDALKEGKVKFWVSGYSRAGATANITSKRLVELYADGSEGKQNQVYGYTCEAPMGGSDKAEKLSDKTKYYCIHNLINAVDIVPLVAPQLMGFKRYGVDHYIPGTDAGEVKVTSALSGKTNRSGAHGPSTVTTYRDNEIKYIKNSESKLKNTMRTHLRAVDSGIIFDDYFHPMTMKYIFGDLMSENGHYANNHAEAFVQDFLRFVQEGMDPGDISDATQAVPNRDGFANDLQQGLRDILALVMTMDSDSTAGIMGRVSSIMTAFSGFNGKMTEFGIYMDVIRSWSSRSAETKEFYLNLFWNLVQKTKAFDFLDASDLAKLQKAWPALGSLVFTLLNADYQYNPENYHYSDAWAGGTDGTNAFIGTFATFATYILQNHYPEVNLAWARTYDSLYDTELQEFAIQYGQKAADAGYTVKKPAAYYEKIVKSSESEEKKTDVDLTEGVDETNRVPGNPVIYLDVDPIVGEAIYYDLYDNTTGYQLETNKLYRGGISLPIGPETLKSFTIHAYAISYGVRSEKAVYNISLISNVHRITIDDGSGEGPKEAYYEECDQITLSAVSSGERKFTEWSVKLIGKEGDAPVEIASDLLKENAHSPVAGFIVPEPGKDTYGEEKKDYPEGYALEIQAMDSSRIKYLFAIFNPPFSGGKITDQFATMGLFYNNPPADVRQPDLHDSYPIAWYYTADTVNKNQNIVQSNALSEQETEQSKPQSVQEERIPENNIQEPDTDTKEQSAEPVSDNSTAEGGNSVVTETPDQQEEPASSSDAAQLSEVQEEDTAVQKEAEGKSEDTEEVKPDEMLKEESGTPEPLEEKKETKEETAEEAEGTEEKEISETSENTSSEENETAGQDETNKGEGEDFEALSVNLNGTSQKLIPVSAGEKVYKDTVYYAVIVVPQDIEKGIVFASTDMLGGGYDWSELGKIISLTRNNTDGSAKMIIQFEKTDSDGEERPESDVRLAVKAFDLNLQEYDESAGAEYAVREGAEVMLTAPDVENELFTTWNFMNSGITIVEDDTDPDGNPYYTLTTPTIKVKIPEGLSEKDLAIRAEYKPGIVSIAAEIAEPEGGKPLQTKADASTLRITVTNEYEVDPEFVSIEWSPEPLDGKDGEKIADFLKHYTATIRIVPKQDGEGNKYVNVRKTGEENYVRVSADVLLSGSATALINGNRVPVDQKNESISYTFDITPLTLVSLSDPADIRYVPSDMSESDAEKYLPKTVTLLTDSGDRIEMPVDWLLEKMPHDGSWTAKTRVALPPVIEDPKELTEDDIVLQMLTDQDVALAPEASYPSGEYYSDFTVTLSTPEEEGTIFCSIGNSEEFAPYDGNPIIISREDTEHLVDEVTIDENGQPVPTGRKMFILKAFTAKSGLQNSAVVTWNYVFANTVSVPENTSSVYIGSEQVGTETTAFYTVEEISEGGRIDEDGSAAATQPGTYQIRLRINDGYQWELPDGSVSVKDQTVKFTIERVNIQEVAAVTAEGTFPTLDDLKKALTVEPLEKDILTEGKDYVISYGDVKNHRVTVTVTGKGGYYGSIISTFLVEEEEPRTKYTITFDLNGGQLNGVTGRISYEYYEDQVIRMPLPSRAGYQFLYWEGSVYRAKEK